MKNLSSVSKAWYASSFGLTLAVLQILVSGVNANWREATLGLIAAVAASTGLYYLRRATVSIDKAIAVVSRAACGDLNARILGIRGHGNIGQLLRNINRLLDMTEAFCKEANTAMQYANERKYFRHIITTGMRGEFARYAATINSSLDLMASRDREFADFAENNVRPVMQLVASAAYQLHGNAEAMTANATDTSSQAVTVAAAAEQTAVNVQTVAVAAEELSASIGEIAQQVARAANIAAEASVAARHTDATVHGLNEAADKIGSVIALIHSIASQTNLLALNATIEAARAGEAGKGFAVVANEVKSLASQTAKATGEIATQIDRMREVVAAAVQAIQSISLTIHRIEEASSAVAGAVEEQNAVTLEIVRNVAEAAGGTTTVSSAITLVQAAAQNTTQGAQDVSDAAASLSERAGSLSQRLDAFLCKIKAA